MPAVSLRPMEDRDLEPYFLLESDEVGADMIALLPRIPGDRPGFDAHWARLRADATILIRTIEADGDFAGYALSFLMEGERQVGYWIERGLWGRGIATSALRLLLDEVTDRPLWGRVAAANSGSRRVLEHAGFATIASERVTAPRLGVEIQELILRLDGAAT